MRERPKILFCMHLPPPVHGASVVGKQIHDSMIIRDAFDCYFLNPAASESVSAIGHFSLKKVADMMRFYRRVCAFVKNEKPKMVYITPSTWDWGFYRDFITVCLLKHYHCKIVAHFHNKPQIAFTQKWYNKWLYRRFFKDIHTIFLANRLADSFRMYLDDAHIHICPNGMPKILKKISRKEKHTPYNFLFVSNMMAEKGVLVLLEACAILLRKGCEFTCRFIGQWSDVSEQYFNDVCKSKGLVERVHAIGPKYGEEKNAFFANADALVFPTFYHGETFGLVLLEAMQYALPIITTSEGALAEVVDSNCGFIVEKQNAEALANKMQYLIENPAVGRKMGINGRVKFEHEYTLESFEDRLYAILRKCVYE